MKDLQLALISVIIPVYNVERYLDACMESVCAQTYTNLEIILVDDGSTDGSGILCERWSKKDSRIHSIHKQNGGLSDARNAGIDKAAGAYITFVDSDDMVSPDMIEHLYHIANSYGARISVCDPVHCYPGEKIKYSRETKIVQYDTEDALCEMMYQTSFLFAACGKLYRSDLFRAIKFPVGLLFEDVAVMYKLFSEVDSIVYSNAKLYGYLHRENSITTNKFSRKDCDIITICRQQLSFAESYSSKVYNAALSYQVVGALRIYLNAPDTDEYAAMKEECQNLIEDNWKRVITNKYCRNKLKMAMILFATNKSLLKAIYLHIDRWK